MKNNTFLLLAASVSIITMGAGCAKPDTNDQAYTYNTPSAISATSANHNGNDELAITAIVEPGVAIVKTKTGTSTAATQSYTTAVGLYEKNGTRFQFTNCSGNPGSLNIKRGVKFMIDNRDNESHQIGIGAKTYRLEAYGFAIVSAQKSGNYNITCDGGGVAQVGVEN